MFYCIQIKFIYRHDWLLSVLFHIYRRRSHLRRATKRVEAGVPLLSHYIIDVEITTIILTHISSQCMELYIEYEHNIFHFVELIWGGDLGCYFRNSLFTFRNKDYKLCAKFGEKIGKAWVDPYLTCLARRYSIYIRRCSI